VQPLHTSEHNLSFTHYFRDLFPDPESIFHSLHAALWDEGQRGFKQSSVHSSKSNQSEYVRRVISFAIRIVGDVISQRFVVHCTSSSELIED
jgi:hypothetical protein